MSDPEPEPEWIEESAPVEFSTWATVANAQQTLPIPQAVCPLCGGSRIIAPQEHPGGLCPACAGSQRGPASLADAAYVAFLEDRIAALERTVAALERDAARDGWNSR